MHDQLKIYIESLKTGNEEALSLLVSSDFLEISEKEVSVAPQVSVKGTAYVTGEALILSLDCQTSIYLPCSICNTPTKVEIRTGSFTHSESLSDLPSSVFDYSQIVREELLLLIPHFVECQEGKCPERKELKTFMKEKATQPSQSLDVHFPFKDL